MAPGIWSTASESAGTYLRRMFRKRDPLYCGFFFLDIGGKFLCIAFVLLHWVIRQLTITMAEIPEAVVDFNLRWTFVLLELFSDGVQRISVDP